MINEAAVYNFAQNYGDILGVSVPFLNAEGT